MIKRYAIIVNGKVDNVCLWDGVTPWSPADPNAQVVGAEDHWGIGGSYVDGVYTPPPQPEPEPDPAPIEPLE